VRTKLQGRSCLMTSSGLGVTLDLMYAPHLPVGSAMVQSIKPQGLVIALRSKTYTPGVAWHLHCQICVCLPQCWRRVAFPIEVASGALCNTILSNAHRLPPRWHIGLCHVVFLALECQGCVIQAGLMNPRIGLHLLRSCSEGQLMCIVCASLCKPVI
jgi:hypothetical protein